MNMNTFIRGHAVFDEAWYMQPHRLPAAQLLFDLGLEPDSWSQNAADPMHFYFNVVKLKYILGPFYPCVPKLEI